MGLTLTRLLNKIISRKTMKILLVGLDGAGKSTILYKLRLGELILTIPTIGFNVETLKYKSIFLNVWDVGGQEMIRPLWKHYYSGTSAIIFVVDSSDEMRISEVCVELRNMLAQRELSKAPLLVFANKQDVSGALTKADLITRLELNSISDRQWTIQPACAVRGTGLNEGIDWLCQKVNCCR